MTKEEFEQHYDGLLQQKVQIPLSERTDVESA
eukprot:CAMPEP_0176351454 /NCGR_PEP_ID=MMETSP0126-20121128/10253_1 /TAXON_ID=141414 ORGANISM="Strombidinopsis acuminatum, Strain SPMC142" /NCGR_SAMPLE_ID=MMETSP0126 /ASSEMBLY_ACC=CAM_ASM_000229 /LENGTH=31 /DNA_ID= /DNA_START= /DNA_END= /DNA_ORIENTATION=